MQARTGGTGFGAVSQGSWLAAFKKRDRPVPQLKLSIIMAAYNEQDTVELAISEILNVEYPCNMELIVVDDGSTDARPKLLAGST